MQTSAGIAVSALSEPDTAPAQIGRNTSGTLETADTAGRNAHNLEHYQTLIIPTDGSGGSTLAALQKPILEVRVETICERGCRLVWDAIEQLDRGEHLPETADLSPSERDWVLAELKSVMAVYGDRCRVD